MTEDVGYDLFISYADADSDWVEGYLLDALRQAGVNCHSQAAFALGVPRLLEFERAVQNSRRVLLVLSPAYLSDGFSQFTDILAQSYGMKSTIWPVIPLILHPVALPLRLDILTTLDATNPTNWSTAIARLCEELQRPKPEPPPRPRCPYPGMKPFLPEDAQYFFGREREIADLRQRLRLQRLLLVIGPSGSGKSSLVFAGLIPELQQKQRGEWLVKSMRPNGAPLAALAQVLGGTFSDDAEVADLVRATLAQAVPTSRLLLIVDQFEELFTQTPKSAQDDFIALIIRLSQTTGCALILTIRADFYTDLMASDLWPLTPGQRVEIAPLRGAALRDAIEQPAIRAGVYLEAGLLERLMADAAEEPGVLPLMQETMTLLWEMMERRLLPLSAYMRLGGEERSGLAVAIEISADAALDDLPPEQRVIARQIFLRLVEFVEGRKEPMRRQQSLTVLHSAGQDAAMLDQIVAHLVSRRLLTLSGEEGNTNRKVDIAHESLIASWSALHDWLDEQREAEQVRRRLEGKAAEWVRLGRDRGGLIDEFELDEATRWLSSPAAGELGYSEQLLKLVEASQAAIVDAGHVAARQKARLRWLAVLLVFIIVVAPLGISLYRQVLRLMAAGEMVSISGGRATIGSTEAIVRLPNGTVLPGNAADETPVWSVEVKPLRIERFEVSNHQYQLCVWSFVCTQPQDAGTYKQAELADYPVIGVTAFQAQAYCQWLGRRLPSEVEWEWAARGPELRTWPWGKDPPDMQHLNVSFGPSDKGGLDRVDRHADGATPGGVFNLAGNAMEWTASVYRQYPYDPYTLQSLWDGKTTIALVLRGGSFIRSLRQARPTARLDASPIAATRDIGFRCAQNAP